MEQECVSNYTCSRICQQAGSPCLVTFFVEATRFRWHTWNLVGVIVALVTVRRGVTLTGKPLTFHLYILRTTFLVQCNVKIQGVVLRYCGRENQTGIRQYTPLETLCFTVMLLPLRRRWLRNNSYTQVCWAKTTGKFSFLHLQQHLVLDVHTAVGVSSAHDIFFFWDAEKTPGRKWFHEVAA